MYNREAKRGVISVSGGYMEDNKPTETIRRDVSYTWTENRHSYHFTSTMVNKVDSIETATDEVIATVLPDFYVYPNKEINYSIRPQGKNGFLFVIGKRPLFLCARLGDSTGRRIVSLPGTPLTPIMPLPPALLPLAQTPRWPAQHLPPVPIPPDGG